MAKLVPVDDDPFAQGGGSTLTPVDHNPFTTVDDRAAPGAWDRFLTGAADVPMGIYQMGLHAPMQDPVLVPVDNPPPDYSANEAKKFDTYLSDREQKYQEARKAGGQDGIDWMRMGGNVAATLPLSAIGGAAAPVRAATLGGKALVAAGEGAIGSMLNPVTEGDYGKGKAEQLATGTIGGAVAERLGAGVSKIIKPTFDKAKTLLMSEGVHLTPGQMAGGIARSVEDKATSIPVTGDAITAARRKGLDTFNRAAWNRVLRPLGDEVDKSVKMGADAANHVSDKIDAAYAKVWPNVKATADAPFVKDLGQIDADAQASLPEAQYKQFNRILNAQLLQKNLGTGEALKGVDSTLGKEAAGYKSSSEWDNRKLGDALDDLKMAFRGAVERQNPQYAPQMKKLNEAYANYVRVARAGSSQGAHGGIFTPAQLDNAVRSEDRSVGKRSFGKGSALLQDLSKAGMEVLPSTIPDSGTTGRALLAGGTLGALGTAGALGHPVALAGLLASSAPYTGAGMDLLHRFAGVAPATAGVLNKGQQASTRNAIAQLMARIGTASAAPAGQIAASGQGVPPRLPMSNLPVQPGPPQ